MADSFNAGPAMRLVAGSLTCAVLGWPDVGLLAASPVSRFVVPATAATDFTVSLTCGDRSQWEWGTSMVLDTQVDEAARRVRVRKTEWEAEFSLAERSVVAKLEGAWPLALESLLNTALQLFAIETGTALMLHASAVERGGEAFVFAGHSGAGKSTAALLSDAAGRARFLREELVFVTGLGVTGLGGEPIQVASLPLSEKRVSLDGPERVPLRGIYWLQQADEDGVDRLSLAESVRRIVAIATIGVRHRMLMLPALDLAEEVARGVPVKTLRFRKSAEFWDAIDADLAIDGDASRTSEGGTT